MFGVLNTLPSIPRSMYPIAHSTLASSISVTTPHLLRPWLQSRPAQRWRFVAIQYDLLFLFSFGIGTLLIATRCQAHAVETIHELASS